MAPEIPPEADEPSSQPGPTETRRGWRIWLRRGLITFGGLVVLVLVLLVGGFFLLPRVELGPTLASRVAASIGRSMTATSLRITPGARLGVALRGVSLDNLPGGTRPAMIQLESLDAEIDLLPLLHGEVILRRVAARGLTVLLERVAEHGANWRFGPNRDHPPAPSVTRPEASDRSLPTIFDLNLAASEVLIRTSSGHTLTVGLEAVTIAAAAADQPVILRAQGSYNGAPLLLEATLGSFDEFHDTTKPFPLELRATTGDTVLTLDGHAIDPLNFDGIRARLDLRAPTPDALMAIAGAGDGPDVPLELSGAFEHQGDLWRLTGIEGALDEAPLNGELLEMTEGARGHPDAAKARIDFTRLDVNRLVAGPAATAAAQRNADLPLAVAAEPDPRLEVRLTAIELNYHQMRARDVRLQAAVVPDRVVVDELAMRAYGSRIEASGQLEKRGEEIGISADVALREGDLDTLRRAFGARQLPVSGRVEVRAKAVGQGHTLNAAAEGAHISAVVGMTGGTIAREVIEMASTDIRSLFRTPRGTTRLTCLLGVADIRAGVGEVAPLRIRAATGTVSGIASFDLNRNTLDLVIGSQRETTNFFALDIPMRVSGRFSDPTIRPASWSGEGRARLAASDAVAPLPPALLEFARSSRCFQASAGTLPPPAPPPAAATRRERRRR
jgi:uncharacterized protein involved in outer membrane biogenesis